VAQLNMITNFRGDAKIRSVLAPYHCPTCDQEHDAVIELEGKADVSPALQLPCPTCGNPMEFDELPDSYLAFSQR